jgi:hypothetical protein
LGRIRLACDVLQQLVEDVEAGIGHVAHGVLECPNDGVLQIKTNFRSLLHI